MSQCSNGEGLFFKPGTFNFYPATSLSYKGWVY